ncbi:MAG TPA: hypothetical protein VLR27_16740 [Acidimicrobiales bacterium]|nr:hypothetical protein [Acidimicrobiales bacterium]
MARQPAPPGPPPPHYRPPGSPRPLPGALTPAPAPRPAPSGVSPLAATAVAVLTLLVGLVAGFFLGRAYDDGASVSATSTGTIAPSPTTPTSPPATPPGDTIPQQPPGAPPATDLAPGNLGEFDEPIPAGQAYVLGLYEIEVLGVTRDAGDALAEFAPANPPPPSGQQHVLVELAVRFTDPTGLGSPGSIPFFVSDGDGEWASFEAGCGLVPGDLRDTGFIEVGDEAVGQVCFTVPSDAVDELALGTESFAGPLWFALP